MLKKIKKIVNSGSFKEALEYAFFLLKFRLRTEREILERLRRKKFDEGIAGQVVSFLKEKRYIDDSGFARAWIESRLNKPLGVKRIIQELRRKGIDNGIIGREMEKAAAGYSETKVVEKLAKEKFEKLKGLDIQKAKRRIYAYLLRRGFNADAVIDAVSGLGTKL